MAKMHQNLVELIQSLSTDEKRAFSIFVGNNKKSQYYMQLFEAIEKNETLSAKLFKQKYAKFSFMKSYPSTQQHLYNTILKSLLAQHQSKNTLIDLLTQVQYWQLLSLRGLHQAGIDFLYQAQAIGIKSSINSFQFPIATFLFRVKYGISESNKNFNEEAKNIQADLADILFHQQNSTSTLEQHTLQNLIFILSNNFSIAAYDNICNILRPYYQKQLEQINNLPTNPFTLALFWLNTTELQDILNLYTLAIDCEQQIIEIVENNSDTFFSKIAFYQGVLLHYIDKKIKLYDFQRIEHLFQKADPDNPIFKNIPPQIEREYASAYHILYITYYHATSNFASADAYLQKYMAFFDVHFHQLLPSIKNSLTFTIGSHYLFCRAFDKMEHSLSIFSNPAYQLSEYHYKSQIILLYALWTQESWILLDIKQAILFRLLKKNKEFSDFHKYLFIFIRASIKQPTEAKKALRQWATYLIEKPIRFLYDANIVFPHAIWAQNELQKT
jgi:hypothetical protein